MSLAEPRAELSLLWSVKVKSQQGSRLKRSWFGCLALPVFNSKTKATPCTSLSLSSPLVKWYYEGSKVAVRIK